MRESRVVNEWREEGRQEGRLEASLETLLYFLQVSFGPLPAHLLARLRAIEDCAVLRQLVFKAIDATNLDDFQKAIPQWSPKDASSTHDFGAVG